MNEYKAKKVMEILEKVIKINATRGTNLVATLRDYSLDVYDASNGCEQLINYKGYISDICFGKIWDDCFDELVEAMHEALDKYLEVGNE